MTFLEKYYVIGYDTIEHWTLFYDFWVQGKILFNLKKMADRAGYLTLQKKQLELEGAYLTSQISPDAVDS